MPQPALPPELLSRVIELVKGELTYNATTYYNKSLHLFLVQVSLVCRMWAEETRPYIFHSVRLVFGSEEDEAPITAAGPPTLVVFRQQARAIIHRVLRKSQRPANKRDRGAPRAMRRVEEFLGFLHHNPRIATFVKTLQIVALKHKAAEELNESADVLLGLFSSLSNIRTVVLDVWDLEGKEVRQTWWKNHLDDKARSAITYLLAHPTLENLSLESAVIPCAIWHARAPNLKFVRMLDALSESPSASPILDTTSEQSFPRPQARPLPEAFGRISELDLQENMHSMEDIQEILLRSRRTLKALRVDLSVFEDYPNPGTQKPMPTVDCTHMKNLRSVVIKLEFRNVSPDNVGRYTLQTIATLSWTRIIMLCVGISLKCPESEHPPFDAQAYCNSLDSFIFSKAGLRSHLHTRRRVKSGLRFLASNWDLQMCSTCLQSFKPPSVSSPISRLFPALYEVNKLGAFEMAVRSRWVDAHGKQQSHQIYRIPPLMHNMDFRYLQRFDLA